MLLSEFFPFYNVLSEEDKEQLQLSSVRRAVPAGTLIHGGGTDCTGLLAVEEGQLRAYISSDEGREITLYRLFERDICLFSASCMMNSIQFDVMISVEREAEFWIVPPDFYKSLMDKYTDVSNYTNQIMAARFTDVMWLMEQIMWKSFDRRLAGFLLEESVVEGSSEIKITHEKIANHMGSAREVVTRMLKYFQEEGMLTLTRGKIHILDEKKLREVAAE